MVSLAFLLWIYALGTRGYDDNKYHLSGLRACVLTRLPTFGKGRKNKLSQITFDKIISQLFRDLPMFSYVYSICKILGRQIVGFCWRYNRF